MISAQLVFFSAILSKMQVVLLRYCLPKMKVNKRGGGVCRSQAWKIYLSPVLSQQPLLTVYIIFVMVLSASLLLCH